MLVLLSLNNIRTVLVTLGSLQMFAVVVAWLVLLLPVFTVATEPSVRMIKWVTSNQPLFSSKQAMLTKTVSSQFPKSVSEYSGARGSTQHQSLTAVTAVCGTLQVTIAFSLWVAPDSVDTARLVLLVISGVCCILIGQMESALPWRNIIDELRPIRQYYDAQHKKKTGNTNGHDNTTASPGQPQQQQQEQQEAPAVAQPQHDDAKEPEKAAGDGSAGSESALSRLPIGPQQGKSGPVVQPEEHDFNKYAPEPPLQSYYGTERFVEQATATLKPHSAVLHAHGLSADKMDEKMAERLARFIRDKQQLRVLSNEACSDTVLRMVAPQYTRITPSFQPLDRYVHIADRQARRRQQQEQLHNPDEWRIWVPPSASHISEPPSKWQPLQSDGIALRATTLEGGGIDDGILSDDTDPKMRSSAVHMTVALLFVVLNFVAQGILGQAGAADGFDNGEPEQANRMLSVVLAFVGMGFFLVFSVFSWLTGGYDDVIGMAGKSCCGCLMAREISPALVTYSQWPGRSGVQVGAIHYDEQRDAFYVKPRSFCAFSSCPSWAPASLRDSHYAVDEADYQPNWYDSWNSAKGDQITRCCCTDFGHGACMRGLERCSYYVFLRWMSCCFGRKTAAAMIGVVYISLETVAFSLLVLSVAAEAVSVPLHASLSGQ